MYGQLVVYPPRRLHGAGVLSNMCCPFGLSFKLGLYQQLSYKDGVLPINCPFGLPYINWGSGNCHLDMSSRKGYVLYKLPIWPVPSTAHCYANHFHGRQERASQPVTCRSTPKLCRPPEGGLRSRGATANCAWYARQTLLRPTANSSRGDRHLSAHG
jgi:hypothetical protein